MKLKCNSGEEIEVGAFIASGGMAEVYEGKRISDGSMVAVKFPLRNATNKALALFLDEAVTASEVEHPNVVKVMEWGENGQKFIAFEFVHGITFDRFAAQPGIAGGAIDLRTFRDVFVQLCDGLTAIHSKLVHRDLKPANVLVDVNGIFKISDFGLSKFADETTRTQTFKGWGTEGYRAPETVRGESADSRTDQLALGIILWELLTGERAFTGPDVANQELWTMPVTATDLRADVPLQVSGVLTKMMSKRMDDRFDSVSEACRELHDNLISAMTPTEEDPPSPFSSQIAQLATQVVDTRRQVELEAQRRAAEEKAAIDDRSALVAYEFSQLQTVLRTNVERINQGAGNELMHYTEGHSGNSAMIEFEGWRMNVLFQETSPTNEFYIGWGSVEVIGPASVPDPKGYAATHFVLGKEKPYPEWTEVGITINPIIDPRNLPSVRGQEITGKIVRASTEEGLMEARTYKGVMHTTQWEESPYSHDNFVEEHLRILVEYAQKYPNPPGS